MDSSRKHSLSPQKSPTPGRYRDEAEEDESMLERSIKKLKIDSESHVDGPCPVPLNKRFPIHVASPDDPHYMHDVNFPEVNRVLQELAVVREFREKVRKLRENGTMPTISENSACDFEPKNNMSNGQLRLSPQSVFKVSVGKGEGALDNSTSQPMDTEV